VLRKYCHVKPAIIGMYTFFFFTLLRVYIVKFVKFDKDVAININIHNTNFISYENRFYDQFNNNEFNFSVLI
jgi:hypothetical protein